MIRIAFLDDVECVTALIFASYHEYVPRLGRNPQPMDDDYTVFVAAKQLWVLEHQGEVSGALVCQHIGDHILLRTVAIHPALQHNGFGRQLMTYAETIALNAGANILRLYTNEVMTGNVELYKRLGYIETHRNGPKHKQVVYMMKELHRYD